MGLQFLISEHAYPGDNGERINMAAHMICQGCMVWPPGIHNGHPECFQAYLNSGYRMGEFDWISVVTSIPLLEVALRVPNRRVGLIDLAFRSAVNTGNVAAVDTMLRRGVWPHPRACEDAARRGNVVILNRLIDENVQITSDVLTAALRHPACIDLLGTRTNVVPNNDTWTNLRSEHIGIGETVRTLYRHWPAQVQGNLPAWARLGQ